MAEFMKSVTDKAALSKESFKKYQSIYLLFLIGLIISYGLFIILGWHFNYISILQVKESVAPAYSTGVGFTLSGLATLLVYLERPRPAFYLSVGIIFFVLLISTEHAPSHPINWAKIWPIILNVQEEDTLTSLPMSPLSIVGFLLASSALVNMNTKNPKRYNLIISMVLGQFTLVVGFVAIMSYFLSHSEANLTSNIYSRPVFSAIGLLVLGRVLVTLSYLQEIKVKMDVEKPKTYFLCLQSLLITLILSISIYWSEEREQQYHLNHELTSIAAEIRQTLERIHKISFRFLERWKTYQDSDSQPLIKTMNDEIDILLRSFPEIEGVMFIDDHYKVLTHIFNDSINGMEVSPLVESIRKRAESIEPRQNYFGLNTFFPHIFAHVMVGPVKDNRSGMVVFLVNVQESFNTHLRPKSLEEYSINVKSPNHQIFRNIVPNESNLQAQFTAPVLNQEWTITIKPNQKLANSWRSIFPQTVFILGLINTLIMFFYFNKNFLVRSYSRDLEKYRDLLVRSQKIARIGVWVWNLEKDTIWLSEELQEILGLEGTQLISPSKKFFQLIHPSDYTRFENEIRQIKSGKPAILESFLFVRSDNQNRYIRFDARVTEKHKDYPLEIIGVIQDITDYKDLENQLQQAQKLELLGQLTGGIAHDFNNILMVIQGNLELIEHKMPDDSPDKKRINAAISASDRAAGFIKRLLSFSRKQPLSPTIIHLNQFMPGIITLMKRPLGETVELTLNVADDVWDIAADVNQLESALVNLAINARDALESKGKIVIRAENVSFYTPFKTRFQTLEPGSYVKISVEDNGPGIPEEIIDRIIEPFFTTKAVGKGTGLGLSMVYGFATQSRGALVIDTQLGQGTSMSLYIPKSDLPVETEEEEIDVFDHPQQNKNITILIVEDEDEVREIAIEYLTQLGYQVLEAANGEEALSVVKQNPQIDLMLSDVVMPGKYSGPEAVKEALVMHPNLKIVLCSGYPRKENVEEFNFIKKPYTIRDLAKIIASTLASDPKK